MTFLRIGSEDQSFEFCQTGPGFVSIAAIVMIFCVIQQFSQSGLFYHLCAETQHKIKKSDLFYAIRDGNNQEQHLLELSFLIKNIGYEEF